MSTLYLLFQNFVAWMLNPGRMVDSCVQIFLSIFVNWIPTYFPGTASAVGAVNAYFAGAPFAKVCGLTAYLLSPIIDPWVTLLCVDVLLGVWLTRSVIALAFMIKGWISGQGAA